MQDEKTVLRKKRLARAIVALTLVIAIAFAVIHVNLGNALTSALRSSLNTFELVSVEYLSVSSDAVDLRITFALDNPSSYVVTLDAIMLSLWTDKNPMASIQLMPNQTILSGEKSYFHFLPHVTDERVLASFHNQTYSLTTIGSIRASASFLFAGASFNKDMNSITEVNGIG